MYVQVSKFEPLQISPNAFLTRNGVLTESGRSFAIYTVADVKNLLGVLQTHIVAAIGGLLQARDIRGRLPWEFVNEQLFLYAQSADNQAAHKIMVEVAPYLLVARQMVEYSTQEDDQRALCAFVDLYLDPALGMSKAQILEARGQGQVSIDALLNDESSSERQWKSPIIELPWPGDLGANIRPLDDFSASHLMFDFSDLMVVRNQVWASMGSSSKPIPMELRLSELGVDTLRDFLQLCRTEHNLDTTIEVGDTVGGNCAPSAGASSLAARHGEALYRIYTYPTKTGDRYWSLRYIARS
jgi:hypothetical protein